MPRDVEGILFDLGDTLLDFGRVDVRGLFEDGARLAYQYLEELGQPVPSFSRFHRKQLWAVRWNYLKSRLTRREFNALDLIGVTSRRMGQQLTEEQTTELAWLWYEPLSECATVEPGLPDLLERWQGQGLLLGVVSNTFVPREVLDRHLHRVGLLEYLPVRVYSCDVRYRKPNPNIFRIALDRSGLPPEQVLFVGDSPRADIEGARRMGMRAALKDPEGRFNGADVPADHRIRRLAELDAILASGDG